ncbi:hypothetical protein [Embleya scabrispora]|uniref:hypothetical protein n=1 Tax=Embleya scabrispora TaxID=159449 RepID=UPI001319BB5D|nr:hypothetical protein [Embleya scabrispora]MYS87907.1 hypothetical protein [Streptomyces sp. SID5474]
MSDSKFTDRLVTWLRGLDDSTLGDPQAVVRNSPGFYPTTILAFWPEEMARRGLRLAPTAPTPCPSAIRGTSNGASPPTPPADSSDEPHTT